jgi:hypothetical protein
MKTMMYRCSLIAAAVMLTAAGCGDDENTGDPDAGGGDDGDDTTELDAAPPTAVVDVESTALAFNLTSRAATAVIALETNTTEVAFEVGDLAISAVTDASGALEHDITDGVMTVTMPTGANEITVAYEFAVHDQFDGWDPAAGLTFLWPQFCGNLYPCRSNPDDGSTFTMEISGGGDGVLIYPASIPAQAPTYMPAIARGDFTTVELGETTAGTVVRAYHLPGQGGATTVGAGDLREVVDFFELTYGPYTFGDEVASVSANWGPGAYGGMEHHPYWHVASDAWDVAEIHAHEAAHGWYGNGVRIECWEDFVLSEGLATYLAARALGSLGTDLWADYDCYLADVCEDGGGTIALPSTCNEITILTDPLWSSVPYQKGAQFLREVAAIMGEAELDAVIAAFYQANVGEAARMSELLDAIEAAADPGDVASIEAIETAWLYTEACPVTAPVCKNVAPTVSPFVRFGRY